MELIAQDLAQPHIAPRPKLPENVQWDIANDPPEITIDMHHELSFSYAETIKGHQQPQKMFEYRLHTVSPDGSRVWLVGSRNVKKYTASGYHIGLVRRLTPDGMRVLYPRLVKGDRTLNKRVINNESGRRVTVGSREFTNKINAGGIFTSTPDSDGIVSEGLMALPSHTGTMCPPSYFTRYPIEIDFSSAAAYKASMRAALAAHPNANILAHDLPAIRAADAAENGWLVDDIVRIMGTLGHTTRTSRIIERTPYLLMWQIARTSRFPPVLDSSSIGEVVNGIYHRLPANPASGRLYLLEPTRNSAAVKMMLGDDVEDRGMCAAEATGLNVPPWCTEEELRLAARKAHVRIYIYTQNCCTKKTPYRVLGYSGTSARKIYCWYQANHLIRLEENKPPYLYPEKVEWIDPREGDPSAFLAAFLKIEPVRVVASIRPENGGDAVRICAFATATTLYKSVFALRELDPKAYSNAAALDSYLSSLWRSDGDHIPRPLALDILESSKSIFYEETSACTLYKYDLKRAFRSSALCPLFDGFPEPSGVPRVVRITSDDLWYILTGKQNKPRNVLGGGSPFYERDEITGGRLSGLVHVLRAGSFPVSIFIHGPGWYTLPTVRFALMCGENFEYDIALIVKKYEGDIFEKISGYVDKTDKNIFHRIIGRYQMKKLKRLHCATSYDESLLLRDKGYKPAAEIRIDDDKTIYLMQGAEEEVDPVRAILAGYVLQYATLTLYHDIVDRLCIAGMTSRSIRRIWVDSVELDRPLPGGFLDNSRWHDVEIKNSSIKSDVHVEQSANMNVFAACEFNPILFENRIVITGGPGCGKSHYIRSFFAHHTLTAPTHLAASVLGDMAVTTQKLLARIRRGLGCPLDVVVDEFTMLNASDLELLCNNTRSLVLAGDINQIKCVKGEPITIDLLINGFDFAHIHLSQQYRTADKRTADAWQAVCNCATTYERIDVLTLNEVPTIYEIGAELYPGMFQIDAPILLTGLNKIVLEENTKYASSVIGGRVLAKFRKYWENDAPFIDLAVWPGMRVIATRTIKNKIRNQQLLYVLNVRENDCDLVTQDSAQEIYKVKYIALFPAFAVTYHRAQGQTFGGRVVCDVRSLTRHPEYLYVGASRVRDLNSLTMLSGAQIDDECYDEIYDAGEEEDAGEEDACEPVFTDDVNVYEG